MEAEPLWSDPLFWLLLGILTLAVMALGSIHGRRR